MMFAPMPSPLGHSLAGLTVGWLSEPAFSRRPGRWFDSLTPWAVWCAVVAVAPDADLLFPHFHRTATHSVTATVSVLIITAIVTGKVTRRPAWGFAIALAAGHATHLLLDWLGTDRFPPPGLQMLWPFSGKFFYSGIDLFPPVERRLWRSEALGVNALAAFWEFAIMGPVAAAAWFVRQRRRRWSASDTTPQREAASP